jgi:hypothetical protein
MSDSLNDQAKDWLESLQSAALSGDKKAAEIYEIAKRIADNEDVNALDCATFEAYCLWVKQNGRDDLEQYAWCDGCNDVLLPIGKTCSCGRVNLSAQSEAAPGFPRARDFNEAPASAWAKPEGEL